MKARIILTAIMLAAIAVTYVALRRGGKDSLIGRSKAREVDNVLPHLARVRQSAEPTAISTSPQNPAVSYPSKYVINSSIVEYVTNETGTTARFVVPDHYQQEMSGLNTQIVEAISEFQNRRGDRERAARAILPLLKPGMARADVKNVLGAPTEERNKGTIWVYVLGYGSAMALHFDGNDKMERISGIE